MFYLCKDSEIQGFSHKRTELLKNRYREEDITEHNSWGKDKNKQENKNKKETEEARNCRFQNMVFNMPKEVTESIDVY